MATETKVTHTPAPWTLETVATSIGVCHKVGPLGSTTKIKNACLYDDCYSDEPRDLQLLADARLIAAAPELLAALKLAVSRFEYNPGHSDLDNEQPIHLPITLGDYRRINMLIHRAEGK